MIFSINSAFFVYTQDYGWMPQKFEMKTPVLAGEDAQKKVLNTPEYGAQTLLSPYA